MTRYSEEIKVLRRAAGGRNGPFEEAAKCIIFLDWQNSKFEERLSWFKGIETPTDIARKKTIWGRPACFTQMDGPLTATRFLAGLNEACSGNDPSLHGTEKPK